MECRIHVENQYIWAYERPILMIASATQLQRSQVKSSPESNRLTASTGTRFSTKKSQATRLAGIILFMEGVHICLQTRRQCSALPSQALPRKTKQLWKRSWKEKVHWYQPNRKCRICRYASPGNDAYSTCEKPPPVSDFVLLGKEKQYHQECPSVIRHAKAFSQAWVKLVILFVKKTVC
jgi:hypothetical protein